MVERKHLMTIWRQGAFAPWTNLLRSVDGLGYAIHHYTVDGSAAGPSFGSKVPIRRGYPMNQERSSR